MDDKGISQDAGFHRIGDVVSEVLDKGSRGLKTVEGVLEDQPGGDNGRYRARSPTRSERLNRSLKELGLSAFKVHILIWTWRGAPAKGNLPYFTIRSLEKFCGITRPTVRSALGELVAKGWVERLPYNPHHKNTLYRLIAIRKVPRPLFGAVTG